MNVHKFLKHWHPHPDYDQIAELAVEMARAGARQKQILKTVSKQFGSWGLPGMREDAAPAWVLGELGAQIPMNAYEQLMTSLRIPPAVKGALMPDAHHGYSVPIGAVVALENAISPAFIGFDIGCMVMLSIYEITPDEFGKHRDFMADMLRRETAFGLGVAFTPRRDHAVMDDKRWQRNKILRSLSHKAHDQLGTSGGGNHFADLMIGEVLQPIDWLPLNVGSQFVALLTHSGSRGVGHKVATHYMKLADQETRFKAHNIPKGYGWLAMDTEAGREYWDAMQLMGRYAVANHELIHRHFAESAGLQVVADFWNRHNFAWEQDGLYIHRKGATPAEQGVPGIIPGTSGTYSYLTSGLGNDESMQSSSHGAGRPHSRTEAKRQHNETRYAAHMREKDILHFGVNKDETFMAYKDIESVLGEQEGVLLKRVARLMPRVVIMGGKA